MATFMDAESNMGYTVCNCLINLLVYFCMSSAIMIHCVSTNNVIHQMKALTKGFDLG